MDISGTVLRRSPIPCGVELRRDRPLPKVSVQPKSAAIGGFSDKGHLLYYASSVRCGGGREKKREKLVKGLAKDLAALCEAGIDVGGESRQKTITEAAQMLMTELNQLRAQEKEMKRRKKEEKAAAKAAKMMKGVCADEESSESSNSDCEGDAVVDMSCLKTTVITEPKSESLPSSMHGEVLQPQIVAAQKTCSVKKKKACAKDKSSSSSESSESSDSDCEGETIVNMSNLKTTVIPAAQSVTAQSVTSPPSMCSEVLQPQTMGIVDVNQNSLKIAQIVSSCVSNSSNNISSGDSCVGTSVVVEKSSDKIEVCMGGKCKRSGAVELLQEFEKKIGMEGAVVGCKCMGKCKEGPNVRVVTQGISEDLNKGMKNPLCIGVGIEDVPMIVANFFRNEDEMGLMAA